MHIAIDISSLSSGHGARGIGRYTKLLVDSLKTYDRKNSYFLFSRGQKIPTSIDLVHYPAFDPFFITLPLRHTKPFVVTIHDVTPLVFPDKFPVGLRGLIKWQIQRWNVRRASRIMADSECSKKDIISIVSYPASQIDTVYLAPAPVFTEVNKRVSIRRGEQLKHTKPYFLYVGDINWNKNLHGLLTAFAKWKNHAKYELVCVGNVFGQQDSKALDDLQKLVKQLSIADTVRYMGFITDAELIGLYKGAQACIMPSWYEGFGFPILEAMACGCPMIASHGGSLNEIAGPSLEIQPDDYNSFIAAFDTIITESFECREQRIMKGYEWVQNFRWEKTIRSVVQTYEKAFNYHTSL